MKNLLFCYLLLVVFVVAGCGKNKSTILEEPHLKDKNFYNDEETPANQKQKKGPSATLSGTPKNSHHSDGDEPSGVHESSDESTNSSSENTPTIVFTSGDVLKLTRFYKNPKNNKIEVQLVLKPKGSLKGARAWNEASLRNFEIDLGTFNGSKVMAVCVYNDDMPDGQRVYIIDDRSPSFVNKELTEGQEMAFE
jgi:hypothetical protein